MPFQFNVRYQPFAKFWKNKYIYIKRYSVIEQQRVLKVFVFRGILCLIGWLYYTDSILSYHASICNYLQTHIMTEQQIIRLCPVLSSVKCRFSLVIIQLPNGIDPTLVRSFTVSSVTYSASPSFIHLVVCLTTGPKPLPKRALHIVRSRASSFRWEYPLLSLR
jgi:hypothetical protein